MFLEILEEMEDVVKRGKLVFKVQSDLWVKKENQLRLILWI